MTPVATFILFVLLTAIKKGTPIELGEHNFGKWPNIISSSKLARMHEEYEDAGRTGRLNDRSRSMERMEARRRIRWADIQTFSLTELCPSTSGGRAYISLGSVAESLNSTAVIKAAPELGYGYYFNTSCELQVSAPPGHHIVASVRKVHLRRGCIDKLIISADGHNHTLCGTQFDEYERHTLTAQTLMTFEFTSGLNREDSSFMSEGFQIIVTNYKDAPCNDSTEYTCENDRCISKDLNCSIHNHCGDNSNQQCATMTHIRRNCSSTEFTCANGDCISNYEICNDFDDCGDLSDELNCTYPCLQDRFPCSNGYCIANRYICDGYNDCGDFSDEASCDNCPHSQFACRNGKCVKNVEVCNQINDCGDWSDEDNCTYNYCSVWQFTCKNARCVMSWEKCNGINDCGDWSDEQNCTYGDCWNWQFPCKNGLCVGYSKKCNGENDCGDGSDEENCPPSSLFVIGMILGSSILVGIIVFTLTTYLQKRQKAADKQRFLSGSNSEQLVSPAE